MATTRLPIGVTLGTIGVDAGWWLDAAERLDAAGYRAIWAWDHVMGRGDPTAPVLEAWTMLAAAASRTRSAFLGTFVDNVMNREPALVARMASTLQAVSGGRFRLGIAIGGNPREHEAYGIPLPPATVRADHLREAIAVIRALWSGGPVSFAGAHYRLVEAYAFPRPAPEPPILVGRSRRPGSASRRRWVMAGRRRVPRSRSSSRPYRAALASAGRERASQLVVVGLGGGRTGRPPLDQAWIDDPRGTLAAWQARGADEVTVTVRTESEVERPGRSDSALVAGPSYLPPARTSGPSTWLLSIPWHDGSSMPAPSPTAPTSPPTAPPAGSADDAARAALTHGCVRCGTPIPLDEAMCERCNPLGLRQPSASQAHGTALAGVALAIVVLAVVARVMTSGIGPFPAEVANVVAASDGLTVTISLTNKGTTTSATSCRLDDAGMRGIGPGAVIVQSPNVPPGQQVTFETHVTTLGTAARPLSVTCGEG